MRTGLFIVLEGVEGAGKSTQARLLSEWFESLGLPHTLAREPGGTPVGEAIRRVVLDRGELTMPPETELFLILGARAAFVRDVVRPASAKTGRSCWRIGSTSPPSPTRGMAGDWTWSR